MKSADVTLSIIVPAYNAEKYLEECVNSILCGQYQNFEVLLVDDGSTDGTGALCDQLAMRCNKIKVFHIKNQGSSVARNFGIEQASGKYIGFVDADDLVAPEMFEMMVSKMEEDVQLACCRFHRCKRDEIVPSELSDYYSVETGENVLVQIAFNYFEMYVWNKLFRRDILMSNQVRFKKGYLMQDQYFVADYLRGCDKAVFLDARLYYYCDTDGGVINKLHNSPTLPAKYMAFPRGNRYVAELFPQFKRVNKKYRLRAAASYMRLLRKIEPENDAFTEEAVAYVRKNLILLMTERQYLKFFVSGVVLSISYPLWKWLLRKK